MHWSQAVMEFIPTEETEHPDLVTFLVGEGNEVKKFFLHKTWLKLSSERFRKLLLQNEKSYNLPDIKPRTFEEIVKHIYTFSKWEFNGNLVDACCLLKSASDNDLEELTRSIVTTISKISWKDFGLTSDTACFVYDVLRSTSSVDEGKLKDVILSYICKNAKLILNLDSFLKLSLDGLLEVLGNDNLQVSSELEVFKAVVRWGMNALSQNGKSFSPENLQEVLSQPLQVVRFSCMSKFEFEYYVQRMGFKSLRETISSCDNALGWESNFEMLPLGISSVQQRDSTEVLAGNRKKRSYSERTENCIDNLEPTMEDILRAELYVSNYMFQVETSVLKSMLSEFKVETRRVLLTSTESFRKQVEELEKEIAELRGKRHEMSADFKALRIKVVKLENAKICPPCRSTQLGETLLVQQDKARRLEMLEKDNGLEFRNYWTQVRQDKVLK